MLDLARYLNNVNFRPYIIVGSFSKGVQITQPFSVKRTRGVTKQPIWKGHSHVGDTI